MDKGTIELEWTVTSEWTKLEPGEKFDVDVIIDGNRGFIGELMRNSFGANVAHHPESGWQSERGKQVILKKIALALSEQQGKRREARHEAEREKQWREIKGDK